MQQPLQHQFREDEIITMSHWDKSVGAKVSTPYPKIGGRLRIAHENNDQLSITTKVISYDGQVAVVSATTTTDKGSYNGVAMASVERDAKIAPAILELAESRAIARSLRFCGIGVEYCSAEEVSHLPSDEGNGSNRGNRGRKLDSKQDFQQAQLPAPKSPPEPRNNNSGNNGNTAKRLSSKQLVFIMRLATGRGLTKKEIDDHCINVFGVATNYLSQYEASIIIDEFNTKREGNHA